MSYDTGLQDDADMGTFVGNWEVAISEVYSRPRVVPVAEQIGFKGGSSMDLVTQDEFGRSWDFIKVEMRNHAYRRVMEEKPFLLIGSPMCKHWSTIMNLNYARMSWEDKERLLADARVHLEFVCKLYKLQHGAGRYFTHEHLQGASSWKEKSMQEIKKWTRADCFTIDQCQYGLTTRNDAGEEVPARKPTTVMTNCPALGITLNKRCKGEHQHQQLIGGKRTAEAQAYPKQLCKALVDRMALRMQ